MPTLNPSAHAITKHEEFWYADGSVVLIVDETHFRIHQSILSRQSEFFAGMFTVPQPTTDAEIIEGCPVVRLPDSLPDVVDTLKALYQPFHFDGLSADADLSTLISFISGILRISTKYDIPILRHKCIAVLQRKFPSTLAGCDALLASQYQYLSAAVVRAIPLARETNVPEILPWAFYISTHIQMSSLLADAALSWEDKALCLAGKERLWEVQKSTTHAFLFDFAKSPQCVSGCPRGGLAMGWRDAEGLRVSPHPLERYTKWTALGLCPRCLPMVEEQHAAGRLKVWGALPGMFGLGTWDNIRKNQNC